MILCLSHILFVRSYQIKYKAPSDVSNEASLDKMQFLDNINLNDRYSN